MREARNSTAGVRPTLGSPAKTTQGSARILVLCSICLVVGFGGGVFAHYRAAQARSMAGPLPEFPVQLAEGAKSMLQRMQSPVEIRLYSVFTEEPAAESRRLLAGRVAQLLTAIENASAGKVRVVPHLSATEAERRAAAAEGLTPLDLETSEACYLGIVVAQGDHRETLPQLAPEWERAVEADVLRAVFRVAAAAHRANAPAPTSEAGLAAAREVQNALPNLAQLSAEEAERMLRETAMKELKVAAAEMEAQEQAARQQLERAQQTGSEAERQAAARQLQQVQAAQTAKLKTAAARLRDQIAAMERLKASSATDTPAHGQPATPPQR